MEGRQFLAAFEAAAACPLAAFPHAARADRCGHAERRRLCRPHCGHDSRDCHAEAEAGGGRGARTQEMAGTARPTRTSRSRRGRRAFQRSTICVNAWLLLLAICPAFMNRLMAPSVNPEAGERA